MEATVDRTNTRNKKSSINWRAISLEAARSLAHGMLFAAGGLAMNKVASTISRTPRPKLTETEGVLPFKKTGSI